MARFLIVLGLAILVIGLLWPYLSQIGLGRLPGDVVIDTIMRLTRPTHPFRAAMLHPTRTLLGRVALVRSPGRGLLLSSGSVAAPATKCGRPTMPGLRIKRLS
jgi:hypothetical protein